MRAGPLANPKVIELLNRYFVPVYISNEDYRGASAAVPKEEVQAWQKIYSDAVKEKRSSGAVCVYLVTSDGTGIASMVVSRAAEEDNLREMLQAAVDRLKVEGGKPVVPPSCQMPAPKVGPTDLLLHLVSRADHRYSWGEFPSENWIILNEDEWKAWLPPAPKAGTTYAIPAKEAAKVLTCFFPQTEICNFSKALDPDGPYKHRIEKSSLEAKVLGTEGQVLRIRLDGSLKLKHTFYPDRDDTNYAESTLVGYLDVDPQTNRLLRLRLATSAGHYGRFGFSVAVQTEK